VTRFRDLSVRHKQMVAAIVVVVTALAVVISAFVAATVGYMRSDAESDLEAQAAVIADSIASAVEFSDLDTVREAVRPLAARSTIDFICIYSHRGTVFSKHLSDPTRFDCSPLLSDAPVATSSALLRQTEIRYAGSTVGTLVIQRNWSDVNALVRFQLLVTVAALGLGIAAAATVVSPLHRSIATPLMALAETARQVSRRGDYSLRARKQGDDEVGQLVDTFNQMLTVIAERDDALSVAASERARLLEREKDANRVKDEFLAALSHELRTPLNAIAGWVQILQKAPPPPEMLAKALASIQRNTHAQGRLIEDLLDISRIVSGKLTLKIEVVDLARIVDSASDVARTATANKGISLVWEMPADACLVSGDADRLHQVMWNLLSNAIKFTPAGGRITVQLQCAGERFIVSIADTGIGIDPAFLPFVFDRFRQADGSVTREHGGLGLGLAIAREIIELHGGSISAESGGRGQGSRFVLELPALSNSDGARLASNALSDALPAEAAADSERLS